MKTAKEIIDDRGISLKLWAEGNHRALCPKCSKTRKKKEDKCLSVKINHQGVFWNCHHCEYQGGDFFDATSQSGTGKLVGKQGIRSRDSSKARGIQRQNGRRWADTRHSTHSQR